MTEPLLYEADPVAYLDRQNRLRAHLAKLTEDGARLDVLVWASDLVAIQREVEPIPLVIGVRYRWRVLISEQSTVHRHAINDAGDVIGLDLPVLGSGEYTEIEGVFRGRRSAGPGADLLVVDVAGHLTGLGDVDVLRIEEIR